MILIHPPVAKPSEPPAGIARLSGALSSHGIGHAVLDANLEGLLYMIERTRPQAGRKYDVWTARSLRDAARNYAALRDRKTYRNIDRYKRAVSDLNHAVEQWAGSGAMPGIANYRHDALSPLRSADLVRAAECPEENPYYPYFSTRLPEIVSKNTFRFAGFSLTYLSQALCTFAMIGFLKREFPDLSIVLGGGLVTSWMQNPDWRDPFRGLVDHLVAGQGEKRLCALLGTDNGAGRHVVPDHGLFQLDAYLAPVRILPYSASSGCYWNRCSFCPERAEKNPYVPVPADMAMQDLKGLILRTGPGLVHLLDNAVSTPLLKRLADAPLGVPWYGFARISSLLTNIDFCMALKRSGCVMLKLGLESGDQEVLDTMEKGIDIGIASRALKTLKKAGIATYVYLIFGTPAETLPAARRTLAFVARHREEIGFLNTALFNMPVCGPEVSRFETQRFYDGDLSLYTDFRHPRGWHRKEVRLFLENEFKKERAVAGILRKDPPVFTSNHAPFFAGQDR